MSTIKAINIQHPSSANTNIVMDANGNMTVAGTVVGGTASSGMRNRLINGDFRVWQRGTSFSSAGYTADRWTVDQTGTWARSTDVPSSSFLYSMSCSATVASGGSYTTFHQRIEAINSYDLVGKKITVSFWVKNTSGAAAIYVGLSYPNAIDNFSATTSIENLTSSLTPNTWTKVTLTTSSVLPSGVANGLDLFIFAADASNTRTFLITGIQLEEGTVATPFERRMYGHELQLCQRYFHSTLNEASKVGFTGVGYGNYSIYGGVQAFPTIMRVQPTMTLYRYGHGADESSFGDGTVGRFSAYTFSGGGGQNPTSTFGAKLIATTRGIVMGNLGDNTTAGTVYMCAYTASAEL